jgi:hypothetical protein
MKWISEADRLPPIAQTVLLAVPRQNDEFWDLTTAKLLVQYEGVAPTPIAKGSRWPTTYWWERNHGGSIKSHPCLVTGNAWWTLLDDIPLPPGAEHKTERGHHYIAQPLPVFVTQGPRS